MRQDKKKHKLTISKLENINYMKAVDLYLTCIGHGISVPKRSFVTSVLLIEYDAFLSPFEARYSSASLGKPYPLYTLTEGLHTYKKNIL